MATRFVYGSNNSAYIESSSNTYATAQAGSALAVNDTTGFVNVGQQFLTPTYFIYEGFLAFDTSTIAGLSSASLQVSRGTDSSVTDFTINARIYDWASAVDTGDWRTPVQLAALTLAATLATSGAAAGFNTFADVALLANINTSGFTRFVFSSSRMESSTAPTGDEYFGFTQEPDVNVAASNRLSIVDSSTQASQTISAGTTTFTPVVTGVHDIDAYAGGARSLLSASQEPGGGGGGYAFYSDNLTSLSSVTVAVGAAQSTSGTAGNNTSWGTAGNCLALGGTTSPTTTGYAGLYVFLGGPGIAAQAGGGARAGSGGSASGNPLATGASGTAGVSNVIGTGGVGANGGGSGGNGGLSAAVGITGTVPGGGSGGGGNGADAGNGAAGRMIVYWYVPAAVARELVMVPMRPPTR